MNCKKPNMKKRMNKLLIKNNKERNLLFIIINKSIKKTCKSLFKLTIGNNKFFGAFSQNFNLFFLLFFHIAFSKNNYKIKLFDINAFLMNISDFKMINSKLNRCFGIYIFRN